MRVGRWIAGGLLLWLGALNALLAWNMETCTGGAADSLLAGVLITLPFYVAGWLVLPKRTSSPGAIIAVASIPAAITTFISIWTVSLASGQSACNVITALPFEKDGREGLFVALWGATCFIFWIGLGISLKIAARIGEKVVEQT
jgi:hypothetical protein